MDKENSSKQLRKETQTPAGGLSAYPSQSASTFLRQWHPQLKRDVSIKPEPCRSQDPVRERGRTEKENSSGELC